MDWKSDIIKKRLKFALFIGGGFLLNLLILGLIFIPGIISGIFGFLLIFLGLLIPPGIAGIVFLIKRKPAKRLTRIAIIAALFTFSIIITIFPGLHLFPEYIKLYEPVLCPIEYREISPEISSSTTMTKDGKTETTSMLGATCKSTYGTAFISEDTIWAGITFIHITLFFLILVIGCSISRLFHEREKITRFIMITSVYIFLSLLFFLPTPLSKLISFPFNYILYQGHSPAILQAAKQGDMAAIQTLLKKGVSINSTDSIIKTPLHYAVEKKDKEMILFLLQNGANPNLKDGYGKTPLMIAREIEAMDIITILEGI